MVIRETTLKDLDKLLEFEQGVIQAERPFDSTLKDEKVQYYDMEKMIFATHIQLLVAEIDFEIIGSGYARIENAKPYLKHQDYASLGFMYTDPNHRGKGINSKVIEALKIWCYSQNIVELRLDVYYQNTSAIKAYEKAGFKKHLLNMRLDI